MKKHFSSLLLFSVCLALLSVPLARCQISTTIPFNEDVSNSVTTSKSYAIDLSNLPQDSHIAISALQQDSSRVGKLFVSKTNRNPNSLGNSDWNSQNSNGNIIILTSNELKDVKTLYVGLQCPVNTCKTKLRFEFTKEIKVNAGDDRTVETSNSLGGASSAIVRLSVPKSDNADRIIIHIDAIPSQSDETPTLNVFLGQGREIPYASNSGGESLVRSSWFEGRTLVITSTSNLFCTGCEYTLSLQFNENASINIDAKVFQKETQLGGFTILDGVKKDTYNSYLIKVEEQRKSEDIVIDLRPQEGSPLVYLNCDKRPGTIGEYYWKYHIDNSQEIVLTARERAQCQTDKVYIAVFGDETSVYSVRASIKKANKLFVGKDSQLLGDIFPNEKITYEIFTPLFSTEKVIVRLDTKGTIDANIINCRFPSDCPGLLPADLEYKYQDTSNANFEYKDFKYNEVKTDTGRNFVIDPHNDGCYPILIQDPLYMEDAMPVCAYQITLSSSQSFPQEYTLYADSQGHKWLFPSIPSTSSVTEGQTEYFVVSVPPHKDAQSVNFQLTEFSGDVVIFISKTNKYPNEKTDDTKFAHEGMIIFNKTHTPELNGTYYVAIKALTTSSFGLSVNILGKDKAKEDYALLLEPGVPQRGVLLPKAEHPSQFYKFKMNVRDGWKGSVKISVTTLRGNVLVAVNNNGNMPLPNLHQWKSYGRELEISSTDTDFKPSAMYYIGVFVDWKFVTVDDIVFTISYNVKEESGSDVQIITQQHQFLSPLTPFYGKIKTGEIEFFEAFVLPKDKKITIFKRADSGDVDIFLTTDPKNLYPTAEKYTYTTKNTFNDFIELNTDDFTKICGGANTELICSFYFAVIPRGGQWETSYSLTMVREYQSTGDKVTWIPLEDGRQSQFDVPSGVQPARFYFYTTPYNPGAITVYAPGKAIAIFASKSQVTIGTSAKPDLKEVSTDSYEYSSYESGSSNIGFAHLVIPAYDSLETNVVSVAVYFYDLDTPPVGSNLAKFSILASSQMTYIFTGTPYYGSVEENKYTYFYFDVFKPKATLLISMTTLDDGDPDLVVSLGYETRPTVEQHQFASISKKRTEVLEIDELDIYPMTSMEGTWVVGVYGRRASTFTLTVAYEDQKMVDLTPGQPFELYMKEDSWTYFTYFHPQKNGFEVKLDMFAGEVDCYITTLKAGQDLASNLPNKTNNLWSFTPDWKNTLTISADDKQNCADCVFLIALNNKSPSKLSITITEGSQFSQVQSGITYTGLLDRESTRKYIFSSGNLEELALSLSFIGPKLEVFVSHNPTVNSTHYIWKAELTPNNPSKVLTMRSSEFEDAYKKNPTGIHNGKKLIPHENNTYYISFGNPLYSTVNYTFSLATNDVTTVLKHGSKHSLNIPAQKTGNVIFYSSEEEEIIKINIEFKVSKSITEDYDPDFEKYIRKGLPLNVFFWSEKSTSGMGEQVSLFKDYVMMDNVIDNGNVREYSVRQAYTAASRRGKFNFELYNPFYTTTSVQLTAYSTEFGTLNLEPNSQFSSTLSQGISETFEIYLGAPGAWYFFVQSCNGVLDFSLESNPDKLAQGQKNTQEIGIGMNAIRQTDIDKAKNQYVRIGRSSNSQVDAQFILTSSFFPGEKTKNYAVDYVPSFTSTFEYGTFNSRLSFDIPQVRVDGFDERDQVTYRVKICPINNDKHEYYNFCKITEDCRTTEVTNALTSDKNAVAKIDRLLPGQYEVQIFADIQHNGKVVRFVPYQGDIVTITKGMGSKISEFLNTIMIGLAILVLVGVVGYKCFGKLKTVTEDRGFELPAFGRKREYGFLGDDL